jgi:hypothetical protein
MSAAENFTPDACEILDLFYARDGAEPDWAAIKTRLFAAVGDSYPLTLNLLHLMWDVYEDTAAFETLQYHLKVLRETE